MSPLMENSSRLGRRTFLAGATAVAVAPLAACGGGSRGTISGADQVIGGVVSISIKEGVVKGSAIKMKIILRNESDEKVVVDRGNFGVRLPSGQTQIGDP